MLEQELLNSEESGQQGSITHAYTSVIARHDNSFSLNQKRLLQAIVIASKLGLKAEDEKDAICALSELSSAIPEDTNRELHLLQEEYNVIEWDGAHNSFDILGDAVPRTQLLSFIRQGVANTYDESGKSTLFASRAAAWCDLLSNLECDFAEKNKISTREWRYSAVTSNLDFLPQQVKWLAIDGLLLLKLMMQEEL